MGCNASVEATKPDAPVELDPRMQVVRPRQTDSAKTTKGGKTGGGSSKSTYHAQNSSTGTSTSFPETATHVSDDQQSATQTTETTGQQTARAEQVTTGLSSDAKTERKLRKEQMKERKRLRLLGYKKGFSHDQRPHAWKSVLEADKLYEALPSLYKNLLLCGPSMDDDIIRKDLGRTFPTLPEFTSTAQMPLKGHYIPCLYRILTAYANLDTTVGYCQGMSFMAGLVLLAGLEEIDAFYVFVSLMLKRHFAGLYQPNLFLVQLCNKTVDNGLSRCSKKLSRKLSENCISAQIYATSWLMTGFARSTLPISTILTILDVAICETGANARQPTVPKFLQEASKYLEEGISSGDTNLLEIANWEFSQEAIAEYRNFTDAKDYNRPVRPQNTLLRSALVLVMQRKRRLMECGGMETLYPVIVDGELSVVQTSISYQLYVGTTNEIEDDNEQNKDIEGDEHSDEMKEKSEDRGSTERSTADDDDDTASSGSSRGSPVGELQAPANRQSIPSWDRANNVATRPRSSPSRRHSEHPSPQSRRGNDTQSWRRLTLQAAPHEHSGESARTARSMITTLGLQYSDSDDDDEEDEEQDTSKENPEEPPSPTRRLRSGTAFFSVKPFSVRKLLRQRTRRKTALEFKRNSHLWTEASGKTDKVEEKSKEENTDGAVAETAVDQPSLTPVVKEPLFSLEPSSSMPEGGSWRENVGQRYVSREKVSTYITSTMESVSSSREAAEVPAFPEHVDAVCDGIPCESWMLPEKFLQLLSSKKFSIKKVDVSAAYKELKGS